MRINTNIMALNAQNKLSSNQSSVEKSIQKLSSGLRINGAADDASGLAISEKMRAPHRDVVKSTDRVLQNEEQILIVLLLINVSPWSVYLISTPQFLHL